MSGDDARPEFEPTGWWKVLGSNGDCWCETSSESEARDAMREGDTLHRLYKKTEYEWRSE